MDIKTEKYLGRELKNLHQLKECSDYIIDSSLEKLKFDFVTKPYRHQKACFIAGTSEKRLLFFLWMGTGKTKLVLDLLAFHRREKTIKKRTLVLVPSEANIVAWQDEVKVHRPEFVLLPLLLNKTIPGGASVVVSTYQRLVRLMTDDVPGRKGKKRWAVNLKRLNFFAEHFDAIICDESTHLMNSDSLTTRIVVALSWRFSVAYGLTGTPFGRDPNALFSQFLAIDKGAAFGSSEFQFQKAFFNRRETRWKTVYEINPSRESELRRAMRNSSVHFDLAECITLPPVIEHTITVPLSKEASLAYHGQKRDFLEDAEQKKRETNFIRLRQIATGFKVYEDDEEGRLEEAFDENPKLDALFQLLTEIPENSKIIIFNDFIFSGDRIAEGIAKLKIMFARLYSGTKDSHAELRKFLDEPKCRILLCNAKSGAYGLNLQIANYLIFYESPVSGIVRMQAFARPLRASQTKTVFFYDIVSQGTIEERIVAWGRQGKDYMQAVLSGKEAI